VKECGFPFKLQNMPVQRAVRYTSFFFNFVFFTLSRWVFRFFFNHLWKQRAICNRQ